MHKNPVRHLLRLHLGARESFLGGAASPNALPLKYATERFYPPSVNARHNYGAIEIRWRCITNENEAIEIK